MRTKVGCTMLLYIWVPPSRMHYGLLRRTYIQTFTLSDVHYGLVGPIYSNLSVLLIDVHYGLVRHILKYKH